MDDCKLHEFRVSGYRDAAKAPRERRQWSSQFQLRDRRLAFGVPPAHGTVGAGVRSRSR